MTSFSDASDPFVAFPSERDIALLDDAFTAAKYLYLTAWDDERVARNTSIPHKVRWLGRALGDCADAVFDFYIAKAISDSRSNISPYIDGDDTLIEDFNPMYRVASDYEPWNDIGLPLPFHLIAIESTEDGTDWMRFGEIGPLQFGFTGQVPSETHTVCFQRQEGSDGFQVVFVGDEIDAGAGRLL